MVRIDFNSFIKFGQNTLVDTLKGLANVHRKNSFLATDRLPAKTQVRRMCSPILWQLSDKNFLLRCSIPLYGFCSDNMSPESSGHRDLSASDEVQVVPLRYSWKSFSKHSGKAIGVAVSDSPTGPFVDARGSALVTDAATPSPNAWDDIDPTVFIDDEGTAWMAWGNPNCYLAKLKPNMIEIDGSIQKIDLPDYTEGPWLYKRGDFEVEKYILSEVI
jgi:hypothetical protein